MEKILIQKLLDQIKQYKADDTQIMEVCGTHTQALAKHAISSFLPKEIKLLSGPGCPVCVTPETYIDNGIKLLFHEDVILTTFGDMVRVKGSYESLGEQQVKGKKAVIVYSPFDVIEIAQSNPDKLIVFLSVGFETTAPIIASMVKVLEENKITNIKFFTSLKLMPPILREVLKRQRNRLSGIICPGHVATVMGEEYFYFIFDEFNIPSVICGFDALDIISGIYLIMKMVNGEQVIEHNNIYKKWVYPQGNLRAKALLEEVFNTKGGLWRGIGYIEDSELTLNEKYQKYDAAMEFELADIIQNNSSVCNCSHILLGDKVPLDCELFGEICNPNNPKGPCMVSSEGTCAVYYKYRR